MGAKAICTIAAAILHVARGAVSREAGIARAPQRLMGLSASHEPGCSQASQGPRAPALSSDVACRTQACERYPFGA
jgi:hypothetical protein